MIHKDVFLFDYSTSLSTHDSITSDNSLNKLIDVFLPVQTFHKSAQCKLHDNFSVIFLHYLKLSYHKEFYYNYITIIILQFERNLQLHKRLMLKRGT